MAEAVPVRWYCEQCDVEYPDGMTSCPQCRAVLIPQEAPMHWRTAVLRVIGLGLLTVLVYAVIFAVVWLWR